MRKSLALCLALVLTALVINSSPLNAQTVHRQCRATGNDRAPNLCVVGVPSTAMNAVFQYQRTPVWCWAASMAMILAYYGRPVSQDDIVADIFGRDIPTTLPVSDVLSYLDHTYVDTRSGRHVMTRGSLLYGASIADSANLPEILRQLTAGHPLLVFTPRHAMVMTAVYYYADEAGNEVSIAGVVVRDPFPYEGGSASAQGSVRTNPGERLLSDSEYSSIQYVFALNVR